MRQTVESFIVTRRLRGQDTEIPVKLIFDVAKTVDCPTCAAKPGEWCDPPEGKYLCPERIKKYKGV